MKILPTSPLSRLACGALLALSGITSPAHAIQPQNVTIQEVTPAGLKAAIARNKGKVVFVNFWATWCPGCVKELPALAQLKKQNAGKMVLLLVSAYEQAPKPQIQKMLASKGHGSTLLFRTDLQVFFNQFDPKFRGTLALPVTYIYKKDGTRAKTLTGEHTYAEYQKLVSPYFK